MPTFDPHVNFAFSTVATAPSPATTGTSLTLAAGGGARFPAAPFNITISPANATRAQMATGAEIARVTAIAGDVLTITRAAEGPNAARAVVVGDEVALSITIKDLTDIEGAVPPTGSLMPYAGDAAPAGWLICDGSAVSRATYAALYNILVTNKGSVTVTIATPAVFTTPAAHGLLAGDKVFFETTGALPTGLSPDVAYIVTAVPTSTTFRVSNNVSIIAGVMTPGGDVATSVSQSGVHTLFRAPYCMSGVGFSATTFNLPDLRRNTIYGYLSGVSEVGTMGMEAGEALHALSIAEIPQHDHNSGTAGQTDTVSPAFTGAIANESAHTHGPGTLTVASHSHTGASLTLTTTHTHLTANFNPAFRGANTMTATGSSKVVTDVWGALGATSTFALVNPSTDVPGSTGSGPQDTIGGSTGSTGPGVTSGATAATSHTHGFGTMAAAHSHALAPVGSGNSHQNLPPYIVMNYIIRT